MPRFGKGIYAVMPTPFDSRGAVDLESVERLTRLLIARGVTGLVILGVLGEASKLFGDERAQVIARVLAAAEHRVPVIVGTSHPSTLGTRALSRAAAAAGAQGVMISPPAIGHLYRHELIRFFQEVADDLDADIILQDHPASTGVVLPCVEIATVIRAVPAIQHVKLEDPPTPRKVEELCVATDGVVLVFGGLGAVFLLEELNRGAAGTMTGFAYPEILIEIYQAHSSGDNRRAAEIFYHYLPLIRFEAQEQIGLSIRKYLYRRQGAITDERLREPGLGLDAGTVTDLESLLTHLGVSSSPLPDRIHA